MISQQDAAARPEMLPSWITAPASAAIAERVAASIAVDFAVTAFVVVAAVAAAGNPTADTASPVIAIRATTPLLNVCLSFITVRSRVAPERKPTSLCAVRLGGRTPY